jgi:hypothetical protein
MSPSSIRPTIQSTIERLATLAREVGADLVHVTQLELWGATVEVHWDNALGTGLGAVQDLPREAHLFFSTEGDVAGRFQWAFVYCPMRYIHCLDEGLTDQQAEDESRRLIEDMDSVVDYLLARPYRFVKRKEKVAS